MPEDKTHKMTYTMLEGNRDTGSCRNRRRYLFNFGYRNGLQIIPITVEGKKKKRKPEGICSIFIT